MSIQKDIHIRSFATHLGGKMSDTTDTNRVSKTFRLAPKTPETLKSIADRLKMSQGRLIDLMAEKFANAKHEIVLGK
jgi:predicted DNA-binding ribbon-helix-helix protein